MSEIIVEPRLIAIGLALGLMMVLFILFCAFRQFQNNQAIIGKEYYIPWEELKLITSTGYHSSLLFHKAATSTPMSRRSSMSGDSRTKTNKSDNISTQMNTTPHALYNDVTVSLRDLAIIRLQDIKYATKERILFYRDSVHHLNVMDLYGITNYESSCYSVSTASEKGILRDIVQNDKFYLDSNFKYSIALDIANGMSYLHKMDIIHGNLSSNSCLIDERWTVRIGDWEKYGIKLLEKKNFAFFLDELENGAQDDEEFRIPTDKYDTDENILARSQFWTDPEFLIEIDATNQVPKRRKTGDVYSFAMIVIEIFTREDPYDEYVTRFEPKHIIKKVKAENLRPEVPSTFSLKLVNLIELCWEVPSESRPNFAKICKFLNEIRPSKKSVLDCMMKVVETYAVNLEKKVEERTQDLESAKNQVEVLLHQILPPTIANKLSRGEVVEPETVESVTVFFSDIVSFTALSSRSTALQIVNMLNHLYTEMDKVVERHNVWKLETIGDSYLVISGLPKRNTTHPFDISGMACEFAIVLTSIKIDHLPREKLRMRAGIHTGPVAAGVVGLKMPKYCLFGDTVNVASRMESNSLPNKIQCSSDTAKIIQSEFNVVERGEIFIKGKGIMTTFWIHGKKKSKYKMPEDFLRIDEVVNDNKARLEKVTRVRTKKDDLEGGKNENSNWSLMVKKQSLVISEPTFKTSLGSANIKLLQSGESDDDEDDSMDDLFEKSSLAKIGNSYNKNAVVYSPFLNILKGNRAELEGRARSSENLSTSKGKGRLKTESRKQRGIESASGATAKQKSKINRQGTAL